MRTRKKSPATTKFMLSAIVPGSWFAKRRKVDFPIVKSATQFQAAPCAALGCPMELTEGAREKSKPLLSDENISPSFMEEYHTKPQRSVTTWEQSLTHNNQRMRLRESVLHYGETGIAEIEYTIYNSRLTHLCTEETWLTQAEKMWVVLHSTVVIWLLVNATIAIK
jgi:hypothetical protein